MNKFTRFEVVRNPQAPLVDVGNLDHMFSEFGSLKHGTPTPWIVPQEEALDFIKRAHDNCVIILSMEPYVPLSTSKQLQDISTATIASTASGIIAVVFSAIGVAIATKATLFYSVLWILGALVATGIVTAIWISKAWNRPETFD